uniref:Uncharacterized protein n=1 Tax=Anguilla anguilla TaxID=7936 RepID=A0A0E9TDC1_ANGAN
MIKPGPMTGERKVFLLSLLPFHL